MEERTFRVEKENSGKRVDTYLKEKIPEYSRSFIQYLISEGNLKINEKIIFEKDYHVKENDSITIKIVPPPYKEIKKEKIDVPIIYEDSSIVAVDKPPFMVVHPACGNYSGTLLQALSYKYPGIYLVHRLDKETSGLIIACKNKKAQVFLQKQFKERTVKKVYLAIVKGKMFNETGRIEAPLQRNPLDRKKFDVVPYKENSRMAITEYKVLDYIGNYTLLEVYPKTGRTHQIRVHLSHIGFPVAGDPIYGKREFFPRTMLHSYKLEFIHPETKERVSLSTDIPEDFKEFIEK